MYKRIIEFDLARHGYLNTHVLVQSSSILELVEIAMSICLIVMLFKKYVPFLAGRHAVTRMISHMQAFGHAPLLSM